MVKAPSQVGQNSVKCASAFALLLCLSGRIPGSNLEGLMTPLTVSSLSLNDLVRADVLDIWDVDERDALDAEAPTRVLDRLRRVSFCRVLYYR